MQVAHVLGDLSDLSKQRLSCTCRQMRPCPFAAIVTVLQGAGLQCIDIIPHAQLMGGVVHARGCS